MIVELHVAEDVRTSLRVAQDAPFPLNVGADVYAVGVPEWEGGYEVVPTTAAQVLPTTGYRFAQDFTVGAIPQNYGLITYNGSTITVS